MSHVFISITCVSRSDSNASTDADPDERLDFAAEADGVGADDFVSGLLAAVPTP